MFTPSSHKVLIVEDEAIVRESLTLLLRLEGYEVSAAAHGFDALSQLKKALPTILLSDLNMPFMSGFEFLSVVRRRFPQISVIAMSGAYPCGDVVPSGVIADAFYGKGQGGPKELLRMISELIQTQEVRAADHERESAPVWTPRNGRHSDGTYYVVLTCTDCLRPFQLNITTEQPQKIHETACLFCPNTVRYIVDFSLEIASFHSTVDVNAVRELKTISAQI